MTSLTSRSCYCTKRHNRRYRFSQDISKGVSFPSSPPQSPPPPISVVLIEVSLSLVSFFFYEAMTSTQEWKEEKNLQEETHPFPARPLTPQPTKPPTLLPMYTFRHLALVKHRSNKRKRPPPMQSNNTVRKTRKSEVGAGSDEEEVRRDERERERDRRWRCRRCWCKISPEMAPLFLTFFSRETRRRRRSPVFSDEDIILKRVRGFCCLLFSSLIEINQQDYVCASDFVAFSRSHAITTWRMRRIAWAFPPPPLLFLHQ